MVLEEHQVFSGRDNLQHIHLRYPNSNWLNVPVVLAFCVTLFAAFRPKRFAIIIKTLPRDIEMVWVFVKLGLYQLIYKIKGYNTIPKIFRNTVRAYPNKIAIYFEEEKWTFEQMDKLSNKIGHYFKSLGYKRGDSVALLMDSRPEYACIWLGLAKIGVTTALLNTNVMARDTLVHAIKSGKSTAIIFGSRFKTVVESVPEVMPELKLFQYNDLPSEILTGAKDVKSELNKTSDSSLDSDIDAGKASDLLIYIYTSGTTGLPKASIIKNQKFLFTFFTFHLAMSVKTEDILYIPVPLYHSLGGMIGISQCLGNGTSVVVKTKFSATNFFKDCEKYNCTVSLYIGELARYLVLAHQNSKEKPTYRLKKMFGNGMKPTVWKELLEHFNVDNIYEFYGSTEGNFGFFNIVNKLGAIGYIPVYLERFFPVSLIRCDEAGEPIRNEKGYCEKCEPNEPGLLLFKILNFVTSTKFEGYSDKQATKKKILTNVLRDGDKFFNTGDVLVHDDHGFFFFKDRTGDTFRWKGENVSTNEVEDVLSSRLNRDVAVYGVEIPGSEGKAGMAAIVDTDNSIDLGQVLNVCKANLPAYAVPVFVRLVDSIPQTGTFKIQKTSLQKDGYNLNVIKHKLYFLDPRKKEYVEVNSEIYDDIVNCKVRI